MRISRSGLVPEHHSPIIHQAVRNHLKEAPIRLLFTEAIGFLACPKTADLEGCDFYFPAIITS